jgi:hypothetical protein
LICKGSRWVLVPDLGIQSQIWDCYAYLLIAFLPILNYQNPCYTRVLACPRFGNLVPDLGLLRTLTNLFMDQVDLTRAPSEEGLKSAALDLYQALVLMAELFETTDMRYTGRTPAEAQRRWRLAIAAIAKAQETSTTAG